MQLKSVESPIGDEAKPYILIVDDETSVRELLHSFLEEQGFHVTSTGSGIEGIRLAKELPIHLVLTDVCLADSDGLEVLVKIGKIRPSRPVIVMSGFSQADEAFDLARKAGAAACVTKTKPLSELLAQINDVLAAHSAGPAH